MSKTVEHHEVKVAKNIVKQEKTVDKEQGEEEKLRIAPLSKDIPSKCALIYTKSLKRRESAPFHESVDPNSMTYKLMEPIFPENVKKGIKISVQKH